ncbi:MAG: HAMP domain-containing histidine kinase [Flavobacteriaceae bacterium]|nr:HAMP domain-containing histidine kinase [Flavobacteriaceae bacterium]
MKKIRYTYLLIIISTCILFILGIQLYWNYKNYESNKHRIQREISWDFSKSVDDYYLNLVKRDEVVEGRQMRTTKEKHVRTTPFRINKRMKFDKRDSLNFIKMMHRVFPAAKNHQIMYVKLDSLFAKNLKDRKLSIKYKFIHYKNDSVMFDMNPYFKGTKDNRLRYRNSFLTDGEELHLYIKSPYSELFKRVFWTVFVSVLLSLSIISSLFYLLYVIRKQKNLSEIKDDFIANISHEFKTPITTISLALEALKNSAIIKDQAKTAKYIGVSSDQLERLKTMVEKLLETSTLEGNSLDLKKENTDIGVFLTRIVEKYNVFNSHRPIKYISNIDENIEVSIDKFHFENVIINLLDNAMKYGGEKIELVLNLVNTKIELSVIDYGNTIKKQHQKQLFEKFYRIPTGDIHNIKGYGIGLYYCKKIIEKHQAKLELNANKGKTSFKIKL